MQLPSMSLCVCLVMRFHEFCPQMTSASAICVTGVKRSVTAFMNMISTVEMIPHCHHGLVHHTVSQFNS